MDAAKAKHILQHSDLPEGLSRKSAKYASAPKSLRQKIIRLEDKDSEDAKICAAIEIQRCYRGYCTRCRMTSIINPQISKTALYGASKHDLERLRDVNTPIDATKPKPSPVARQRLEEYYNNYVNRMVQAGSDPNSTDIIGFEEFCAKYIQNWWIDSQKKRQSASSKSASTKSPSPTKSQPSSQSSGKRGVSKAKKQTPSQKSKSTPQKKKRDKPPEKEEASVIIQRAWRRHIDVQVYRYYRDLINFKNRGDPSLMLRCINPNEAKFLDAASGIHVKFRLAGDRFPPNIYYKIFTHRPIQDLCANSPKDYTKAESKRKMARDMHNKGDRVPKPKARVGWYTRLENNGWRLVSDRLIHHVTDDPVTWETSNKPVNFKHNKLQRREDVEKKKKQKKIEWMRKMYKQGMLQAKVDDRDTVELIEGAAAGMVATIDVHGPGAVQDWEVDELLDWTTSLNFEDYWTGWKELATSAQSENVLDERMNLFTSGTDPYELNIGGGRTHGARPEGSTRQSHNTPVSSRSANSVY